MGNDKGLSCDSVFHHTESYVPVDKEGSQLLFRVIANSYESKSMIRDFVRTSLTPYNCIRRYGMKQDFYCAWKCHGLWKARILALSQLSYLNGLQVDVQDNWL